MKINPDSSSSSDSSYMNNNQNVSSELLCKSGTKIDTYGAIQEPEYHTTEQYIDPIIEEQLLRKLDLRMTAWGFFASFSNYLNRNNMQNAFTMGMDKDLNIDSAAYNLSVSIFFIGYTMLQIPGNILITKTLPRLVLPSFAVIWSSVVCFMPLVKSHTALWPLRFILGLAESPYYPGMMLLLGSWYKKEELGKRNMLIASGIPVAGAIGGLIASGIAKTMDGAGGLPGWKWLFITEGIIGILVGVSGYFLLPNFPHNTPWLTVEERRVAIARMQNQGIHVISNSYSWKTITNVLMRPYPWLLIILWTCIIIALGLCDNIAIILRDLDFPVAVANLMLTPLYIFGAVASILIGWSSDRTGDRAFHIAGTLLWVSIWYFILVVVNHGDNPATLVLVAAYAVNGNASTVSLCLAWLNEFFKTDHNSRAIAIGFINTLGMVIPNILNVKLWVVTDAPTFRVGKLAGMSVGIIGMTVTILIWFLIRIDFMVPKPINEQRRRIY